MLRRPPLSHSAEEVAGYNREGSERDEAGQREGQVEDAL